MAKRESLKEFLNNLDKLEPIAMKKIKKHWSNVTANMGSDAQDAAPVASSFLVDSRVTARERAKITPTGIESEIVFTVPYAALMESGVTKNGTIIRYKEVGEISYKNAGVIVKKAKKGGAHYLENAVEERKQDLYKTTLDSIGEAFNII